MKGACGVKDHGGDVGLLVDRDEGVVRGVVAGAVEGGEMVGAGDIKTVLSVGGWGKWVLLWVESLDGYAMVYW